MINYLGAGEAGFEAGPALLWLRRRIFILLPPVRNDV